MSGGPATRFDTRHPAPDPQRIGPGISFRARMTAGLIAGAIITTLALVSTQLDNLYTKIGNAVTGS